MSPNPTGSPAQPFTPQGLVTVPDLVDVWHTFRAVIASITCLTGLVLGTLWGWMGGFVAGLLAAIVVVDALIRRRDPGRSALPSMLLDLTVIGVGMVAVQLSPAGIGAPLIYMMIVPALLLPWRHAWWVMAYGAAWALIALSDPDLIAAPDVAVGPEVVAALGYVIFGSLTVALVVVVSGSLDRSRRSRDQFLASISHEIRTPLTSILGWSRLLRDEHSALGDAEKDEALRLIESEASEVTDIIEELLTAAQLGTGSLRVNSRSIDLAAEAEVVVAAKGLEPAEMIEVNGDASDAWGDPLRVRQIIRNLVTNANRYGGDETRINVSSEEPWCTLAVVDNGPGIPSDLEQQVFEPFSQLGSARGTEQPIGLGLTVSRHLAQLMGGDLSYRRESGATVFELTVPTAQHGPDSEIANQRTTLG